MVDKQGMVFFFFFLNAMYGHQLLLNAMERKKIELLQSCNIVVLFFSIVLNLIEKTICDFHVGGKSKQCTWKHLKKLNERLKEIFLKK